MANGHASSGVRPMETELAKNVHTRGERTYEDKARKLEEALERLTAE